MDNNKKPLEDRAIDSEELIENQERKTKMLSDYSDIRNALGGCGASSAVAKAMIEELKMNQ